MLWPCQLGGTAQEACHSSPAQHLQRGAAAHGRLSFSIPLQVPESWLPPLGLPGQAGGGAGTPLSPTQSPLHGRLSHPPSGLRAVSREGMQQGPHSVHSTPTSAAPSGARFCAHVGLLGTGYSPTCFPIHQVLKFQEGIGCQSQTLSLNSRHAPHVLRAPGAVLNVSRGTSYTDMAGLSDILDARSAAPAPDSRQARARGWQRG